MPVTRRPHPAPERSSGRSRLSGPARAALRWVLLGGAFCVLTWCGLLAASTQPAAAATHGQPDVGTVVRQVQVDRTVAEVDSAVAHVTRRLSDDAGPDSSVGEASPDKSEPRRPVTEVADLVGWLTGHTPALDRLGTPVRDITHGPATASVAERVSDAPSLAPVRVVDVAEPSPAAHPSMPDRPTVAAAAEASGDDAVGTDTAPVPGRARVPGGSGSGGDQPVAPMDKRAFAAPGTTSSSAGHGHADGGSGARVLTDHLFDAPKVAGIVPTTGVEVSWSCAGKPRVTPD